MITDQVNMIDGYVINFGVVFDVVANRDANKSEVKTKCMRKLMDKKARVMENKIYTEDVIQWEIGSSIRDMFREPSQSR